MKTACCLLTAVVLLGTTIARSQDAKFSFPEERIARFNIPHISRPPTIDGNINPEEWREAVRVMGVAWSGTLDYRDRPVSFWVAWDAEHLYLAARSDILPGHRLYRSKRETYANGVVCDDCYEFGLFLHDRNKLPGQSASFLKFVVNSLGCGEYMKLYPSIGQNLFNWRPAPKIANRIYERDGRQWWDMEMAMDLKDLQLPAANKAGDPVGILLTAPLKNPDWQWLDVPSATGHLQHDGFPRTVLTADRPYVQIEEISGLHDEKLNLRSTIHNPAAIPVTVKAVVKIVHGKVSSPGRIDNPATVVSEEKTLAIPAGSLVRFDAAKAFPGLDYGPANQRTGISLYEYRVTPVQPTGTTPIFSHSLTFQGTDKRYLKAVPRATVLECEQDFNPVRGLLFLSADTMDAPVPPGTQSAAAEYAITREGRPVAQGRLLHFTHAKHWGLIKLPNLQPGKYTVELRLLDAVGKTLAWRSDINFEKKDEPKVFARWWNNRVGETEKLLRPFEPLAVQPGRTSSTAISCTRRLYQLDGLGLPIQIDANGGPVLARPAQIIVCAGGKESVVRGRPTEDYKRQALATSNLRDRPPRRQGSASRPRDQSNKTGWWTSR